MKILETERLIVRNWEDRDRDLFFEINSDDTVMEFFPHRRSRKEADAMMDLLRKMIDETGYGFYALELKQTGEAMGFCGLAETRGLEPYIAEGAIEIGWRMAARYWGKGYVTESAEALLRYGFEERGLDQIVSFAVTHNHRSTAVMERIGMTRDFDGDFDHVRVNDDYPHLKRHVLYRLSKSDWLAADA